MKSLTRLFAFWVITILMTGPAFGLALDKSTKVTVTVGQDLSVDMYADANNSRNYYYIPSKVRVAAGRDGKPKITILTYVSDGSDGASGGTFNALVTWGYTAAEENRLRQKLGQLKSGARMMGAAPLEMVQQGPSVNVLIALGGNEKVAWSGTAPLSAGGRAAIAANLTPTGAALLDEGIKEGNLAGMTVEMNFVVPFKADLGQCEITLDWNSFKRDFERINFEHYKGGQGAFQNSWQNQNENEFLVAVARETGLLDNSCDFDRANAQQIEFFERAIETFVGSALGAQEEAKAAAAQAANENPAEGEDEEERFSGGDWDEYTYDYTKYVVAAKSGQQKFTISRTIVVRDPVPAVIGNVKEWVAGHENSPGVRIGSVNLSNTEFSQIPVSFTLGATAIEMLNPFEGRPVLNSVTVNLRKQRANGDDYKRFFVFNKAKVSDGEQDHLFEYARGSDREPFEYEYSIDWSFVGQPVRKGRYIRSSSGSVPIEADMSSSTISFDGNSYALVDNNIRGVAAEIKYKFLGAERTKYLNVRAEGEPTDQATVFLDSDARTFAYRTVFSHAEHGDLATPWEVKTAPSDSTVWIYATIPEELRNGDSGFVSGASNAVAGEANKKLDDVLSEFDKL